MTVSTAKNKEAFAIYSGAAAYNWTGFVINADADVEVYAVFPSDAGDAVATAGEGSRLQLTLTTDFTVASNTPSNGGAVTINSTGNTAIIGHASWVSNATTRIAIYRSVDAITQLNEYNNQGAFLSNTIEASFDGIYFILQQHEERLGRTIQLDPWDTVLDGFTEANQRAAVRLNDLSTGLDGVVVWDGTTFNISTSVSSADLATVAGISTAVSTVAGISANVTTVAGISANVTTVAGIAANVTTVAGVAADVTTVAADISGADTIGSAAVLVDAGNPGIPFIASAGSASLVTFGTGLALDGAGELTIDAELIDISGLTPTDGLFIVGNGANFIGESGDTALASLGGTTIGISALKATDGTAGQYLKTDGAGAASFATPAGAGDVLAAANETITGDWTVSDAAGLSIANKADATKIIRFDASGITTGSARTLTWPDFDGTIATLAGTETLTNKTITSPVVDGAADFSGTTNKPGIRSDLGVTVGRVANVTALKALVFGDYAAVEMDGYASVNDAGGGTLYQDTTFGVRGVATITSGGSGYTDGYYTINLTGGGGSGATVMVVVASGAVVAVGRETCGSGYTSDVVAIDWSGITGAGTPGTVTMSRTDDVCSFLSSDGSVVFLRDGWQQNASNYIDAEWAGISGDGTAVDAAAHSRLQEALTAAGEDAVLDFPGGYYAWDHDAVLTLKFKRQAIDMSGSRTRRLSIDIKAADCDVDRAFLDGVYGSPTAWGIRLSSYTDSFTLGCGGAQISAPRVQNKIAGILFDSGTANNTRISDPYCTLCGDGSNSGGGIVFDPTTTLDFADITITGGLLRNNLDSGLNAKFIRTLCLSNMKIVSNAYYGLWLHPVGAGASCRGIYVNNCSIEANGQFNSSMTDADSNPRSFPVALVTKSGDWAIITLTGLHLMSEEGSPMIMQGFTGTHGATLNSKIITRGPIANDFAAGTSTFYAYVGSGWTADAGTAWYTSATVLLPNWDVLIEAPSVSMNRNNDIVFTGGNANYVYVKKAHNVQLDMQIKKQLVIGDDSATDNDYFTTDADYTNKNSICRQVTIVEKGLGWSRDASTNATSSPRIQTRPLYYSDTATTNVPLGHVGGRLGWESNGAPSLSWGQTRLYARSSLAGETRGFVARRATNLYGHTGQASLEPTEIDGEITTLNSAKAWGTIAANFTSLFGDDYNIGSVSNPTNGVARIVFTNTTSFRADDQAVVLATPAETTISINPRRCQVLDTVQDGQVDVACWEHYPRVKHTATASGATPETFTVTGAAGSVLGKVDVWINGLIISSGVSVADNSSNLDVSVNTTASDDVVIIVSAHERLAEFAFHFVAFGREK